jgi:two-component system, chemotaxis family, CheB/CheR fusion protein
MMRMRPYRTVHNVINGVVATFADVTAIKRAEESLAAELNAMIRLQQLSTKVFESAEIEPVLESVLDAII